MEFSPGPRTKEQSERFAAQDAETKALADALWKEGRIQQMAGQLYVSRDTWSVNECFEAAEMFEEVAAARVRVVTDQKGKK